MATTPRVLLDRYEVGRLLGAGGMAEVFEGRDPHAWFIGFTGDGDRQIAVAVVVEEGGDVGSEITGGRTAAPIARNVMAAYIRGG